MLESLLVSLYFQQPKEPFAELREYREVCADELVVCWYEEESVLSFTANVTAYTGIESCHYDGCPMANGERAYVGAAACPRSIALGTRIEVEGMGEYVCADRTAEWVDGRVDLFFGYTQEDYKRAIQFGKRNLTIKIL